MISHVLPDQLSYVWPKVQPMIERGLRHGQGDFCDSGDLLLEVARENSHLWAIHEGEEILGCAIVSVHQGRVRKILVEMVAGTEMAKWQDDLNETMLRFKETVGADCVEASCRPGMAKRLESLGWKKKATVMSI